MNSARYRGRGAPLRLGTFVAGVALLALVCGGERAPARIVYPLPWLGPAVGQVAQDAINRWGKSPPVEIPTAQMARVPVRKGYAGDIDYAAAAVAMPGLVAAVAPQSSRATLLVAPIYADSGVPLIVPTATSRRVRALGPWVFQLAPDEEAEGAFIARFLVARLGLRRITIFYLDADEYGLGLRTAVVDALRKRGVTPVDEVGILEDSPLRRRVEASVRRARPDAVVIAARTPEALGVVRALHALVPAARVVAGDGVAIDNHFITEAGAAASSVYGVAWWHATVPDTVSRAFVARFTRLVGRAPNETDAMYYDAIMVAAEAVRQVGADRGAVRRYLRQLGDGRPPFHGVTGPIAFTPQRRANLLMIGVVDGTAVTVVTR